MRLIIEARMEDEQTSSTATEVATIVAVVERQERSIADLGLTLAEGRALLAKVQSVLVSRQTADWMAGQRNRTVAAKRGVEPISRNRSLPSRVQFHHFPGPKSRHRSFKCDDQFSAMSVGSAA